MKEFIVYFLSEKWSGEGGGELLRDLNSVSGVLSG